MFEFLIEMVVVIIVAYIYSRIECPPSWEKKYYDRKHFYTKREEKYINALPCKYPYIVGMDDNYVFIKTGDCQWTTASITDDSIDSMVIHPAVFGDVYVGDGYRSINQMRQDFENE